MYSFFFVYKHNTVNEHFKYTISKQGSKWCGNSAWFDEFQFLLGHLLGSSA